MSGEGYNLRSRRRNLVVNDEVADPDESDSELSLDSLCLEKSNDDMADDKQLVREAELESLLEELNELSDDISETHRRACLVHNPETTEQDKRVLLARLSFLDGSLERLSKVHTDVFKLKKILKVDTTDTADCRNQAKMRYYEILALCPPDYKPACPMPTTAPVPGSVPTLKLPTVKLPEFSGDLNQWASFKDTFESLIHSNASLDNIRKFHYLRSTLGGAALQTVQGTPLTADNYEAAWTALKNRFDDPRILAMSQLNRIFNFKPITKCDLPSLEAFVSTVLEGSQAVMNLKIENLSGFIIVTYALRLLDPKTRELFEQKYGESKKIPTYDEFSKFIHEQHLHLQTQSMNAIPGSTFVTKPKKVLLAQPKEPNPRTPTKPRYLNCPICKVDHRVMDCPKFKLLNPTERSDRLRAEKRCLNCFGGDHFAAQCRSNRVCRECGMKHHTMVHFPRQTPQTETKAAVAEVVKPKVDESKVLAANVAGQTGVLLGTAVLYIFDKKGRPLKARAVLDCGSQRSFISTRLAQRLCLPTQPNPDKLVSLGGGSIRGGNQIMTITVSPVLSEEPRLRTQAILMDNLTGFIPSEPLPNGVRERLKTADLADPRFDTPGRVDLLLGADLFCDIFKTTLDVFPQNFPKAIQTIFGIVLMGRLADGGTSVNRIQTLFTLAPEETEADLTEAMKKFWEVEEVRNVDRTDPLDKRCEEHFRVTHTRDESGRFMVRLPFKTPPKDLTESRIGTLRRFLNLERRFQQNSSFRDQYHQVVRDYLERDYVHLAKGPGKFFVPHHGVLKESSTTKLRIVFDASHKTLNGSLNDNLLSGPKLQRDIRDVLLRFRNFPVAISNDISQMYPQIMMHPADRSYQHFFYRFEGSQPVREYEFSRLSFGLCCSPFLALRVIAELVKQDGTPYPLASEALTVNLYMDDILTGADSEEAAKQTQVEIEALLAKGGFALKQWGSNRASLNQIDREVSFANLDDPITKVLGMKWSTKSDHLTYQVPDFEFNPTKRGILSTIARIYDPLGYLAPVTFRAKSFLQSLWRFQIDWDQKCPESILKTWKQFFNQLCQLKEISVPRYVLSTNPQSIQVMGFADASAIGYASVVYLRVVDSSGTPSCRLLLSKTRLAPIKPLTIPRLELCAALLLTEMMESLADYLSTLQIEKIYFFSDSMTVLSWLRIPFHRLKIFVANRVAKVLETTEVSQWSHVRSEDNGADVASRGLDPQELLTADEWWTGPKWMSSVSQSWPIRPISELPLSEGDSEIKPPPLNVLISAETLDTEEILERFSSLSRLKRVMAYVCRFIDRVKNKVSKKKDPLSAVELANALLICVKLSQRIYFSSEIDQILKGKEPPSLLALSPILDSSGVLRVGGRLQRSALPYESKFPILLHKKAHLSKLICDHYHKLSLHSGVTTVQARINLEFWIPGLRSLLRQRTHNCLTCHKFRAISLQPKMADLPSSRVTLNRAFSQVGVDYAGPFFLKERLLRRSPVTKGYLCLFVCMATKAVHLELATDLSTPCFLAALDRFLARRGCPQDIFSDNGRNFVGANRKLTEFAELLRKDKDHLVNHLTAKGVQWHFNPPLAPHFGGLWEAAVKSVKALLHRLIGEEVHTVEEYITLFCRIEAVLNSRPLCSVSTDANDNTDYLSPGHFLIGAPLLAPPEPLMESEVVPRTRWSRIKQIHEHFWNRWSKEYLNLLIQRSKWKRTQGEIRTGDVVFLKNEKTSPLSWPVARVLETHPGKDGVTRVVTLLSPQGKFTRAAHLLIPLP